MLLYGQAYKMILSIVLGLILSNTGVALKFIARWTGGLRFTIDDYLMLSALLPYWGMAIGGILMSQNGLGQPRVDVAPAKLVMFSKIQFAEVYLYVFTVALAKASILAMYWRVFPNVWLRRNVYTCGILVLAWTIAVTIANSLTCVPVQRMWDLSVDGTCSSLSAFYYGVQIPNILTDIYIIVMPLREVSNLSLTRVQRGLLVGIFGIATLTFIFDIVRLVAMLKFTESHQDVAVSIIEPMVWTIIEPAVGIFAACLSNHRPLLQKLSKHARMLKSITSHNENSQTEVIGDKNQVMIDEGDPMSVSTDDVLGMRSAPGTTEAKEATMSSSRSISSMC